MRRRWQSINIWYEETLPAVGGFVTANARLLLLTLGAGVLAYGYELTHLTFSIDEELLWQLPHARDGWLKQQRWGMYLLQTYVFPDAGYPFTSAALAIIFLSCACVLLVHRDRTPFLAKVVFCVLFITFPTFAHIQLFDYMGAHVAMGVLLVVVAERLSMAAPFRSWGVLVVAAGVLAFATATHQSLLAAFPTLVLLSLAVDAFRNQLTFEAAVKRVAATGAVFVAAPLIAYAVATVTGVKSDGYVESYFRWGSVPVRAILSDLGLSTMRFLGGQSITYATMPTLLVPVVLLPALAFRTTRRLLTFGLAVGLILSPLAIHVVFGTWMSSRSMMAVPFAFAGLWYLLFLISAPVLQGAIVIFACYAAIVHSSVISRVSFSQELTYQADAIIGSRVLDLIYDVRPRLAEGKTPLAFVGMLAPARSPLFVKDEVFGGSFWEWDGGNPFRILYFLQSLGFPTTIPLALPAEWPRARAAAKDMPAWPDRGCVQMRDGLLIVKLSDAQ